MVDGRFFGHFFWKVEGTVRAQVNSRVAHVWLPYTVINVLGGGRIANIGKLGKFGKLQIFIKVGGSISGHIGSLEWYLWVEPSKALFDICGWNHHRWCLIPVVGTIHSLCCLKFCHAQSISVKALTPRMDHYPCS